MILTKPFRYTITLRELLQKELSFKLKVNDSLRSFASKPVGTKVSFQELLSFIRVHHKVKRAEIPANMHYNRFVRRYWAENPNGTNEQCREEWKKQFPGIAYHKNALASEQCEKIVSWLDSLEFKWVYFSLYGRLVKLGPQMIVLKTDNYKAPIRTRVKELMLEDHSEAIAPLVETVKRYHPEVASKELKEITLMKYPINEERITNLHRDREEVSRKGSVVNFSFGTSCWFRVVKSPLRSRTHQEKVFCDYWLEQGSLHVRHEMQHYYKHGLIAPVSGRYSVQLRYS